MLPSAQKPRIPSSLKLKAVEAVLRERKPVSVVSRELCVARKTIYKWITRYQSSPPRLKASALEPQYISGVRHPRAVAPEARQALLRLVVAHPDWGCRRYSLELRKLGISIGYFGVFRLLSTLGVSTPDLRETFRRQWSGPGRLTPEIKLSIVREALEEGTSISEIAKRHEVARKTLYDWIEKYNKASEEGVAGVEAFRERYVQGKNHPRAIYPSMEGKILSLVASQPQLSVHRLSAFVPASSFTVWKVLDRHNLSSASLREAYASALRREGVSAVRPELSWQDRLKQVFEQFVPTRAPAGPPRAPFGAWLRQVPSGTWLRRVPSGTRLRSLQRFSTFILLSIFLSFVLFSWGRLLGSATSTSQALGLSFASIALTMGTIFFLYSLKYYFTLAVVLSFSREGGEGEAPSHQSSVFSSPTGWLGRLFGIRLRGAIDVDKKIEVDRGGGSGGLSPFAKASPPAEATRDRTEGQAGGLEPDLTQVTLERTPFISVHIPMYNEPRVAERILRACSSFDYERYEVVVVDDSTDETTTIVEQFAERWNQSTSEVTLRQAQGKPSTSEVNQPQIKVIHRETREGFKGGALQEALRHTDPRAEFIVVFDADFVPYPDTLELFLKYFQVNAGTLRFAEAHSGQALDFRRESRMVNGQWLMVNDNGKQTINHQSSAISHQIAAVQGYQWPHSAEASRGEHVSDYRDSPVAAVQGYQWHVLNKSENWITRGVRSEYAGSYVIERSGAELYGGLKQIAGSVYMIRRDLLETFGWGTSLTEDFELTLRLYAQGYRVIYTPYIQAPAECASTLKRLVRQRMRWAEGHSFNIRKKFTQLLFGRWADVENDQFLIPHLPNQAPHLRQGFGGQASTNSQVSHLGQLDIRSIRSIRNGSQGRVWLPSPLSLSEKLEFLYLSPYYLQAAFFLLGTLSWLFAETVFKARLPFWTNVWGWSLVLTNLLSLPLMNTVGLFLEEAEERDYPGILSFILLSYLLTPFQAYAAVKGFIEPEEGPWFRTPKTGLITDILTRARFYRFIRGILPGRQASPAIAKLLPFDFALGKNGSMANQYNNLTIQQFNNNYLSLATANSRFDSFKIKPKGYRFIGNLVLSFTLISSLGLSYLGVNIKKGSLSDLPIQTRVERTGEIRSFASSLFGVFFPKEAMAATDRVQEVVISGVKQVPMKTLIASSGFALLLTLALFIHLYKKKRRFFKKAVKLVFVFSLILSWLLSGWPDIWTNPRFPPAVKVAQAGSQVYSTAQNNTSFTVPNGVTKITVKAWGAGGGGGAGADLVGSGAAGGGGGFTQATIDVTPAETLTIVLGGGGLGGNGANTQVGGNGGGGNAVTAAGGGTGGAEGDAEGGGGGGGGGYAAVKRSTTFLVQAGGGGGGGGGGKISIGTGGAGGAGGGSSGVAGSAAPGGAGGGGEGTSSAGGAGGSINGTNGSANQGGTGGALSGNANGGGGGGGGGRFGGGGGGAPNNTEKGGGGGGGGSDLVTGTNTVETAGSGTTPGNNGDSDKSANCSSNSSGGAGGGIGASGSNGNAGCIILLWSAVNQSAYRFFNNNTANSTDVGAALANKDTAASLTSDGQDFRLRLLLHISDTQLVASGESFKLQIAVRSGTCDTGFVGETYSDLATATGDIRYFDDTDTAKTDGANLTANVNDPTHSDPAHNTVEQDYEEANNFTNTVAAVPVGEDGEWDFSLVDFSAAANTTYCLRVVKSADGTTLDTYTVVPEFTTVPENTVLLFGLYPLLMGMIKRCRRRKSETETDL